MVVGGSVIAYALYAFALRGLTASKVGAFAYLQPLLVGAFAILFANEHVTRLDVVGGMLLLVGVYLAGGPISRHFHRVAHGGA